MNCTSEKVSANSSFTERDVLENLGIFLHEEATWLVKHSVKCTTVLRKCNWTGKGRVRGKALAERAVGGMPYKLGREARKTMEILSLMG